MLTGEKIAFKILEKSKIIDEGDLERVSREIHILKLTLSLSGYFVWELRSHVFFVFIKR